MDQEKIKRQRPFFVFCGCSRKGYTPELFGKDRQFDVALHNYDTDPNIPGLDQAEYVVCEPAREKLETAHKLIPELPTYSYYAFLDDDLEISTAQINELFHLGAAAKLPLFQPSLSSSSFISHKHLRQQFRLYHPISPIRWVPFVEIQCPFFSHDALFKCLWTFGLNCSGWGLDCYFWPGMVGRETYVIDDIAIGHHRPVGGGAGRKLHNGLTAQQELWIAERIHP